MLLTKNFFEVFHKNLDGINMLQVNNGNTRTMREICSKLTIKASITSFWCLIVNFNHIWQVALVFPLLTLNK